MAVSGPIQALIAAFAFGVLFSAASAGFTLYIKGHGSAFFRDGLRLALIIFLASSALWALAGFIATLIDPTASSQCQTAVIFSTLFDQLARTAIEQYLVWAAGASGPASTVSRVLQLLVGGRFIAGMVFVGESRPQFNSTCVPLSSLFPVAISVIAVDAVILILLSVQALSSGGSKDGNRDGDRRKAVLLTVTALAIWQGTSVTLLLGSRTIDLLLRTTIPAAGLLILVALVIVLSSMLGTVGEQRARIPDSPTPQNRARDRDLSTANNTRDFAPRRYEEVKAGNTTVIASYPGPEAAGNGVPGAMGFGGVPVQGQLFPPMRPMDNGGGSPMPPQRLADLKVQTARPKRPAGKFTISNPIPTDSPDMQNALNRIPTTDLATAAKNDREKRADLLKRNSALTAPRPAPKLPQPSAEPMLRKITDVSGKDGYPIQRLRKVSTEPALAGEGLSVEGNASTTSAQLSPASQEQEVRRRSPRQTMPPPAKTPTFQPITPGQPFRIPIPRPPPSPKPEAEPEPVKTPLQRRPSTGLPSNPRVRRTVSAKTAETKESAPPTEPVPPTTESAPVAESAPSAEFALLAEPRESTDPKETEEREETVMFINNIVYDDPSFVNDILQGVSKTPAAPVRIPEEPLDSRESVVNRPRPIRRVSEDRQVFPGEITSHKRTRSGGSILRSVPGSPTLLPPLPPPPKSAGAVASRPQPNDTRSMTFDEKMRFLYNESSSSASTPANLQRKSSVPTLPPLPATFRDQQSVPERAATEEQSEETNADRRLTRTTADRSSIRTQSILGEDEEGPRDTNTSVSLEASRVGDSWFPALNLDRNSERQQSSLDTKRKSSPVIPTMRYSQASDVSAHTRDEEYSTNWGSVHSPLAAVDLQKARCNAQSTYISREDKNTIPVPPIPSGLSSAVSGFGDEVVTVMLDTAPEDSASNNRRSFYFDDDDDQSLPEVPPPQSATPIPSSWHHQIGEQVPTFTSRREKVRSRKMPPPAPLLLNGKGNKKAVMVPAPEPSPLESPDAALNAIQEQLKKFEEPNRDSVASTGRRRALLDNIEQEMENQEDAWHQMQQKIDRDSVQSTGRRIALLEDLEQEMGQLDNRWKSIHQTLDRASMSTLQTISPAFESRPTSTIDRMARSSVVMPTLAERRASRRARMSSLSRSPPNEPSTEEPASRGSSEGNRSSAWQVRLAEAQDEYREHASDSLQIRNNLNFLSVSQATDLGSPTPPETDGSDSEYEAVLQALRNAQDDKSPVAVNYLWVPPQPQPELLTSGLWMSPLPTEDKSTEVDLPALSIRPAARKVQEPLKVDSIRLWLKPAAPKPASPNRLWSKAPQGRPSGKKTAANLTAKRPPRRSKRVTALPDILESPVPLPNKKALGIFQFPWGEKSADATIQQRAPVLRAMPGTMTSGGPRIVAPVPLRPREADEEGGYSSSFFDDYEEEDSGDNIGEDYYDSGDDFDETTLDEIADLLNRGDLPTPGRSSNARDSLVLPTMGGDAIDEYEDEMSDYDVEELYTPRFDAVPEEPFPTVAALAVAAQPAKEARTLWVAHATAGTEQQRFGLPQPDEAAWSKYMPDSSDAVRSKSRTMEPASIESKHLWASAAPVSPKPVPAVWTLDSIKTAPKPTFGLPQPEPAVWSAYLPQQTSAPRPKPRAEEIAAIESHELWSQPQAHKGMLASGMWAPAVPEKRIVPSMTPLSVASVPREMQTKAIPTMWSPAARTVKPQYGLPQPDSLVWSSYLPVDAGRVRAGPRQEEIAPIESTNLWMPQGQRAAQPPKPQVFQVQKLQIKETRMMWAPTAKTAKPEYGLPQPDSLVWASYMPADAGRVRAGPRKEEIAPIQSNQLWTAKAKMVKPLKTQVKKSPAKTTVSTLWTRAVKTAKPHYGLPQPDASVWASYMPADTGRVRASPRKEEIAPIESTQLWVAQQLAVKPLVAQVPKKQEAQPKTKVKVMSTTLWSPPIQSTKPQYGLPQPDSLVWASYVPIDAGRVRAAPRKEEIAPISSTRLWAPKEQAPKVQKSAKQATQAAPAAMWTAGALSRAVPNFGLPQSAAWENYVLYEVETARPQPRKAEMSRLESKNLWAPATPEPARQHGLLWAAPTTAAVTFSKPTTVVTEAKPIKTPALMWQRPAAPAVSSDASVPRSDYRSTTQEPAALSMTKTTRPSQTPLPQISSRNLWAVPRAAATAGSAKPTTGLWSSAAAPVAALFTRDPKRKDYRTTTAEPAALHMVRKPRQADLAALPTLQSNQLWRYSASGAVELDWITISSIRPTSPSVASIASTASTLPSPTSDASSVMTATTRASTAPSVAASTTSGFSLRGWFGKKKKQQEADVPDVPAVPMIPEVLRMPQVAEAPEEFVVKCLDDVPSATPARVPLRQQWRAPVAFRGNWNDALREAVAASYPNTHFALVHGTTTAQWDAALATAVRASHVPRRSVSPNEWSRALAEAVAQSYPNTHFALIHGTTSAQWDAALAAAVEASRVAPRKKMPRRSSSPRDWSRALTEAVTKSYPSHRLSRGQVLPSDWQAELQEAIARSRLHKAYDASKSHPVFAAASLVTRARREDVHPAATGYAFDVAVRHPVYFGSMAVTAADAHPAFAAPARPASRPTSTVRRPAASGRVAALAKRISQMPGADQAPVVPRTSRTPRQSILAPVTPLVRTPVAVAPAASAAPTSSRLWAPRRSQPAAPAATSLWTPGPVAPVSPATASFPAAAREARPASRKDASSSSSATMTVAADFNAQSLWSRRSSAAPASRGRDWLRPTVHVSRVQLRY